MKPGGNDYEVRAWALRRRPHVEQLAAEPVRIRIDTRFEQLRSSRHEPNWWNEVDQHATELLTPEAVALARQLSQKDPQEWSWLATRLEVAAERGIEQARRECLLAERLAADDVDAVEDVFDAIEHNGARWLLQRVAAALDGAGGWTPELHRDVTALTFGMWRTDAIEILQWARKPSWDERIQQARGAIAGRDARAGELLDRLGETFDDSVLIDAAAPEIGRAHV